MLLENKTAVIFGAGGAIGSAVAKAFSREGASVFLAGRTQEKLDTVVQEISADGGSVQTARVDALDEAAVERYFGEVAGGAGKIDVLFNAVGMRDVQGKPLTEMSADDFMSPLTYGTRAQFLTARGAANVEARVRRDYDDHRRTRPPRSAARRRIRRGVRGD